MSTGVAVELFVVCLGWMVDPTDQAVCGIDHLGVHLRLSDCRLGLYIALGADAPEISSAIVALQSGYHGIGLGVVFGSNLFNLAALLGLGAVLVGCVSVKRTSLILDGALGSLSRCSSPR